jgi:hypothetical protein
MLDIAGMSLIGNSPEIPIGDFSTVYQVQEQVSRTTGRQTLKFGGYMLPAMSLEQARVTIRGCWGFMSPEAGVDEIKKGSLDGLRTMELRLIYTSHDRGSLPLSTGGK